MQRKISEKIREYSKPHVIEIKKEWTCDRTNIDGQVSKGAKCSLTCNNGYRLSNLIIVYIYLIVTSDRKTYIRRCQKNGQWSSSKSIIACEIDGENNLFHSGHCILFLART